MMNDTEWLDRVYGGYDEFKSWDSYSDRERYVFNRHFAIELGRADIPPASRILEIGFGSGDFLVFLKERGFECDGIERRDNHNTRLQALGINATTTPLSDLAPGRYDAVFAFDVLEHMTKPELIEAMVQIERVLKPGGHLLARFPNGASPFGLFSQNGDLTHLLMLTPASFGQVCNIAGLRHDGSWNAAYIWQGMSGINRFTKPLQLLLRRASETFISYVHYGTRMPMAQQVTVRATKPMK
jgi:cyclopropane fatty-acyl-phospholipid synthase-like methyltransferase